MLNILLVFLQDGPYFCNNMTLIHGNADCLSRRQYDSYEISSLKNEEPQTPHTQEMQRRKKKIRQIHLKNNFQNTSQQIESLDVGVQMSVVS